LTAAAAAWSTRVVLTLTDLAREIPANALSMAESLIPVKTAFSKLLQSRITERLHAVMMKLRVQDQMV